MTLLDGAIIWVGICGLATYAASKWLFRKPPQLTEAEQIEFLKEVYGSMKEMDLNGPHYKEVCAILDHLSTPKLEMLRDANIRWVSTLARSRIHQRSLSA